MAVYCVIVQAHSGWVDELKTFTNRKAAEKKLSEVYKGLLLDGWECLTDSRDAERVIILRRNGRSKTIRLVVSGRES